MARILVTDGEQRAALAAVRSLGAAGHAVVVCSASPASIAGGSRHARAEAQVPDPLASPAAYVAALRGLVDRWSVDVLLPISEASLLAVLGERDAFGGVTIPFPPLEAVQRVCDKRAVLDAARELGIGVPAQIALSGPGELEQLDAARVRLPLVLKPARSVAGANGVRFKTNVAHVSDRPALDAALDALPPEAFPVLLQERIVGPGVGVFVLLWDGELLASFGHRRLREKPPSGGVSVYRESVEVPADLLERSLALLRVFDWQGVAMIEYKLDARSGRPYLMEINGRLWGSLQLAVDAGVDFPALLVAAATGARPTPVTDYRRGVRSRWTMGEVDHLLARLRRSREALALPDDAPGVGGALAGFARAFGPGSRAEVLRLTDPRPGWRELVRWVRGA